ncbi:MAG: hypothetical protein E6940_12640 [Clostridium septicum]|nr:hypothetical protein [Clostridium septicum]MDU1314890.1 hypothetical protein [Clostridium septicum]WLF70607.1 hypothetical protein Q6375_06400 [Clostridium septicum]
MDLDKFKDIVIVNDLSFMYISKGLYILNLRIDSWCSINII